MGPITTLFESRATKLTGGNPANPSYWVKKLWGGAEETPAGIDISVDVALKYSPVWAAVNIISGAVGFLPMVLYERLDRGKKRADAHPIYTLLHDRPNPYMDALTFRETLQGHVLTWGNAFAEIDIDGAGRATALWPLLPNKTEPRVIDDKLVYELVLDGGLTKKILPADRVLHIKGLGADGIKGYSVISYARNSLSVGLAAEEFGGRFFGNGIRPSGVLEHPGHPSAEAIVHLREAFEAQHKGLSNAQRMMILEEGIKWQQMGIPPEDAQFLETRKFAVSDVARWYQIPPHMLAEMDRATFSNIEHQGIEFVTHTLMRWLKKWEGEAGGKLLSQGERGRYFAEFIIDALLRGDTLSRYDAYNKAITGGWMNRNEAREKENMNPEDKLDEYLVPVNMAPAGQPPAPKPEPTPAQGEPPMPRTDKALVAVRQVIEDALRRMAGRIATHIKRGEKDFDSLMAKHGRIVQDALAPGVTALNALQPEQRSTGEIARALIDAATAATDIDSFLADFPAAEARRLTGANDEAA